MQDCEIWMGYTCTCLWSVGRGNCLLMRNRSDLLFFCIQIINWSTPDCTPAFYKQQLIRPPSPLHALYVWVHPSTQTCFDFDGTSLRLDALKGQVHLMLQEIPPFFFFFFTVYTEDDIQSILKMPWSIRVITGGYLNGLSVQVIKWEGKLIYNFTSALCFSSNTTGGFISSI